MLKNYEVLEPKYNKTRW